MFPNNSLSSILVASDYTYPYTLVPPNKTTAYTLGGIALSNPSQGLDVQLWTAYVENDTVLITAPSVADPIVTIAGEGITELTMAFDQNMNYSFAYVQYNVTRLYWFDTSVGTYVITEVPGALSPRVTLDDRRKLQSGTSDLIFAYVKTDNLYFRLQRERFLTERLLKENVAARLVQMGMNVRNRLQFKLKPYRT